MLPSWPSIPTEWAATYIRMRSRNVPRRISVEAMVGPRMLLRTGFQMSSPKVGMTKQSAKITMKSSRYGPNRNRCRAFISRGARPYQKTKNPDHQK